MKFKKIQTKMLATTLPVILIAFALVIVVASYSISNLATEQIQANMVAQRERRIQYRCKAGERCHHGAGSGIGCIRVLPQFIGYRL